MLVAQSLKNILLSLFRLREEWSQFIHRNFSAPSPTLFKMKTLVSFSIKDGVWIETGTYMGGTTQYSAKRFPKVISIESSIKFYNKLKPESRNLKMYLY